MPSCRARARMVIDVLVTAEQLGIHWSEVDPSIAWHRYAKGIACAAPHWILDASRANELPKGEDMRSGALNGILANTHDAVTGRNWGMQLLAGHTAELLQIVLARRG